MGELRDTLKAAVRQMAFRTSLDNLKKQGVQQVNVLGIDRIIALVDEAVHRSLKSRLVGIEREAVATATKDEFLRLLKSNEHLQKQKGELEQLKDRAQDEVDQLRRELGQQQQALRTRLEHGALQQQQRYDGENAAIAQRVAELFTALAGEQPTLLTVQERVLELLLDVVAGERKTADAARAALNDHEVSLLQRRIDKLNDALAVTERRLKDVAALKNVDQGISSLYRQVQGLSDDDTYFRRKQELMAEIFSANYELQKRTGK